MYKNYFLLTTIVLSKLFHDQSIDNKQNKYILYVPMFLFPEYEIKAYK